MMSDLERLRIVGIPDKEEEVQSEVGQESGDEDQAKEGWHDQVSVTIKDSGVLPVSDNFKPRDPDELLRALKERR